MGGCSTGVHDGEYRSEIVYNMGPFIFTLTCGRFIGSLGWLFFFITDTCWLVLRDGSDSWRYPFIVPQIHWVRLQLELVSAQMYAGWRQRQRGKSELLHWEKQVQPVNSTKQDLSHQVNLCAAVVILLGSLGHRDAVTWINNFLSPSLLKTAFFRQHGCSTSDSSAKYNSRAAQMYREKIRQQANAALSKYGTDVSINQVEPAQWINHRQQVLIQTVRMCLWLWGLKL